MQVTVKKLGDLHPSEKNVRRHTEKQIAEYVRSVNMFGQIRPIVADGNGEIIAGNGLFQALVQMGWETCDCYILDGISEKQKMKLMLADNRIYELGLTDMSVFDEIVKELDGDTDLPGWDEELLAVMNAAADDVDEIIKGYGNFSESDTQQILKKQEQKAESGTGNPVPEERPAIYPQEALEQEKADGTAADVQRFIICPKCGEKICL